MRAHINYSAAAAAAAAASAASAGGGGGGGRGEGVETPAAVSPLIDKETGPLSLMDLQEEAEASLKRRQEALRDVHSVAEETEKAEKRRKLLSITNPIDVCLASLKIPKIIILFYK